MKIRARAGFISFSLISVAMYAPPANYPGIKAYM